MFNFNFVIKKDSDLVTLINKISDECYLTRDSYDLAKSLLKDKRLSIAKLIIRKRLKVIGFSTKNLKLILLFLLRLL